MEVREREVKAILSKSNLPVADFSANPYVGCEHACKYCYASFMKRFTDHPEPWGEFLDVKRWPEITHPEKYRGKEIFLSSVTDPYQPAEENCGRTRALLEQLQGSGCRLSIATKSDLILRDLDLIRTFPHARVAWSINTLDDGFRQQMDRAVSIGRRLEAMRIFHEAGVATTCFISPIFPGITEPVEIISAARDSCDLVWLENLNLRGTYRHDILKFIDARYPHLSGLYRQIYLEGTKDWWHELDRKIAAFTKTAGLAYVRNEDPELAAEKRRPVVVNYFFHEEIVKKQGGKEEREHPGSQSVPVS